MRVAAERGLTHLAITDHGRIDGALEARDRAPDGLDVIVGEEIRTADGDVIGLFLDHPVPQGLSAVESVDRIHEQGGLAGLPHPFDRFRNSGLREQRRIAHLEALAARLDFIEAHNARVPFPSANERAAAFAREHGIPGIASSDAHTILEVGVAYTILADFPPTADGLRAVLPGARLVCGRGSFLARGMTPLAKLVNRMRGEAPASGTLHR